MARRNFLRSRLTASLLLVSGMAAAVLPASTADAATPIKGSVEVWLYDTYFQASNGSTAPAIVYAKPYQWIVFRLADTQNRRRSVSVDPAICTNAGQPADLCDKAFDDPDVDAANPIVRYRWSSEGEIAFFDRFSPATGRFVISSAEQTVPPSSTTTTSPTTTTTSLSTTTTVPSPATTSTTAPTPVRPFLAPDGPATTTTTAVVAPNRSVPPATAPAGTKDKPKDKGKDKAASPSTPTTVAPAPSGTMPPDTVFDPAALTPGPTLVPDTPATDTVDEAAIDASAAVSLLDEKSDDGRGQLLLIALGALAAVLLAGGVAAWFNRSNQWDPA